MTSAHTITAILRADPLCAGRVTPETVEALAALVDGERASIVAWLNAYAEHLIRDQERAIIGAAENIALLAHHKQKD